MECKKSISKREVCNNTILTQETRKASNRQPQLTPKTTDKEEQQKNSQNQYMERNHKDMNRNK